MQCLFSLPSVLSICVIQKRLPELVISAEFSFMFYFFLFWRPFASNPPCASRRKMQISSWLFSASPSTTTWTKDETSKVSKSEDQTRIHLLCGLHFYTFLKTLMFVSINREISIFIVVAVAAIVKGVFNKQFINLKMQLFSDY